MAKKGKKKQKHHSKKWHAERARRKEIKKYTKGAEFAGRIILEPHEPEQPTFVEVRGLFAKIAWLVL